VSHGAQPSALSLSAKLQHGSAARSRRKKELSETRRGEIGKQTRK
jgi:hypothetical protein